ncbi:DUF697 domain-containing protein [Noviherbaspirillum sp. CPCC 100848]|uniref:DUF697 domain-containing protein n=1 Tax=Noviherbaspirillum album TaxID=3080276 RepID=A0ABU6JAL4_9BURK|nr:DUF697 domain-containing protein [Noviherbaspirillum sp. CPCC 100848]MEC4720697.1 DUF697 domain-containing protein [Noviherbaspirillum sp. CPCC 100848]
MTGPTPLTRAGLRRIRAHDVIVHHTTLAAGSMAIPIPGFDVAAELGIQVRMVKKLCELYGAQFTAGSARKVITGIVGGLSIGSLSTAALRYVSFASYFAGTLPSAGLTAAYTYTIGNQLIERLERYGTIEAPPEEAVGDLPAAPAAP